MTSSARLKAGDSFPYGLVFLVHRRPHGWLPTVSDVRSAGVYGLDEADALAARLTEQARYARGAAPVVVDSSTTAESLWERRRSATDGGPCGTCGKPFCTHVCLSYSPDAQTPGPGCVNCRDTGMDQTPCLPRGRR